MIYFLFACFCVFFAFSFRQIKTAERHDGVLFPFFQLRRDIMDYLWDNMDTVTQEEYRPLRKLQDLLDIAVHNYNGHTMRMFNRREILKQTSDYRRIRKQAERVDLPDNAVIKEFYSRFSCLMIRAVLAYTPLIRWELSWWLTRFFIGKSLRARANYLRTVVEQIRKDARRLNDGGRLQHA